MFANEGMQVSGLILDTLCVHSSHTVLEEVEWVVGALMMSVSKHTCFDGWPLKGL